MIDTVTQKLLVESILIELNKKLEGYKERMVVVSDDEMQSVANMCSDILFHAAGNCDPDVFEKTMDTVSNIYKMINKELNLRVTETPNQFNGRFAKYLTTISDTELSNVYQTYKTTDIPADIDPNAVELISAIIENEFAKRMNEVV